MAQEITAPNVWNTDLGLNPENTNPAVAEDIIKAFGFNFVFDANSQIWRRQAGDSTGRQRVTNGPIVLTGLAWYGVAIGTTETLVLAPRANRQAVYFQNYSTKQQTLVALVTGQIAAGFYLGWPNDVILFIDGYTGPVYMSAGISGYNVGVLDI